MLGVSKLGGGVLKVGEIQLGPDESRVVGRERAEGSEVPR